MPEKFTFPSIQQALSLQSAQTMQEIKVNLRHWFNKNSSLKLSENVAWSFKLSNQTLLRRYIHCKFCHAKLTYVKDSECKDNQSDTFKLVKFNLHHDHRFIEKVKQQGKLKTFPQDYSKQEITRYSVEKQKKQRSQKLRKKRHEINKFKKLQLYYRLSLTIKDKEKQMVDVKQLAAKSISIPTQKFMSFLNSSSRGVIQVTGIKKLLKKAGFEKYNIEMDDTSNLLYNKSMMEEIDDYQKQPINSQDEDKQQACNNKSKERKSNSALIIEQSRQFFKELMIFINYNPSAKTNLQNSQGLIHINSLEEKIISKKFMRSMKWNALILYSHDSAFQTNQLYAVILIQSEKFNIRQIKKSFQITFKLLNPLKKVHFQCCLHQQNIYIMGALDLIIQENSVKDTQNNPKHPNISNPLSYFLSPKLTSSILAKCEFIPKVFRKRLIDKICELEPKQVDHEYQKIINQLEKASKIKEYKTKTEEYLGELRQFYENFHKIFLGKFFTPNFIGLEFINTKDQNDKQTMSINDRLEFSFSNFSKGNKYFFEFIIILFDIFQIPNGSFIYQKHSGDMREPTKLERNYANYLIMPDHQYFDEMKKLYRTHAFKGKYYKPKTIQLESTIPDFYQQFCALLYERVYKLKEIFMRVAEEIKIVLIKEIQKSFTLQIQTRTVQQLKIDGIIKIKQQSKSPYIVKILNQKKLWPDQRQSSSLLSQIGTKNLIELEKSQVIDLDKSFSKNDQKRITSDFNQNSKRPTKKLWQCDCKYSRFTYLPCCHQIRCCFTFFTSIQDQIDDFWFFDPKKLQQLEDDDNKSDVLTEDEEGFNESQEKGGQHNSESD